MVYNKYQSTPEQLNLDNYPEEIKEQFFDFINTVPYIKNLISENRPYAKDCPRDQDGKIIIDFTNPPIIEDTDYFRPTAIHFQKYGCITKLRPNRNPNSEYGKWIREETRRCFYGYVRESDGAWITGDMYFFLNYCPIMKVKRLKGKKGIRVVDFPDFLEGQWLRFMYIQHARDNAKHGSELASRGKGKAHPYDEVVYTPEGLKNWGQIKIGDYLFGDNGNITKVIDIPFDDVAPIYEVELSSGHKIKCSEGHLWKVQSHCRGEIIVSTKELLDLYKRPRKIGPHNPKGYELDCTILKGEGAEFPYQATKVDPYTFGLLLGDGCFRNPGYRNTVNLTAVNSNFEVYKNYIPYNYHKVHSGKYLYSLEIQDIYSILEKYGLNQKKSEDKFIPEEYKYNSKEVRIALLKGLLDADGTVSKGKIELTLSSKQMIEDVRWICASLGIPCSNLRVKKSWYYDKDSKRKYGLDAYRLSIFSSINLFNLPRKTEAWKSRSQTAYAQSKYKGYKITNITYCGEQKAKCVTVDNKSHCYLIGEFIPTHNSFSMASIAAKRFLLGELDETTGEPTKGVETFISSYFKTYLNDDGVLNKFEKYIDFCAEYTQFPKKRLTSSLDKMKWTSGYKESNSEIKKGSGNEVIGISVKDSPGKLRGKRGAFIGLEEMGSFPNLIELYSTLRPSMEDGDIVFGMIYAQGCVCAGTKVFDKYSNLINIEDANSSIMGYNGINASVEEITYLQPETYKECVEIVTTNGSLKCSIDHPLLTLNKNIFNKSTGTCSFYRANELKQGDILLMHGNDKFGDIHVKDAYLLGALFGDGNYSDNSCVSLSITTKEEYEYYNKNYNINISKLKNTANGGLYAQIYFRKLHPLLKIYNMDKQSFENKKLPNNIWQWDKSSIADFLAGYFDADGNIQIVKTKHRSIKLTCKYKNTLELISILLQKLGIYSYILEENKPERVLCSTVNNKEYKVKLNKVYVLYICNGRDIINFRENIHLKIVSKRERLDSYVLQNGKGYYSTLKFKYRKENGKGKYFIDKDLLDLKGTKIISINNIGVQRIYNLTANTTHTYLSNGFISSNTAGDKDSDFSAAQKIMYSPRAFNMQPIKNVYDKVGQGKPEFVYFYPAYVNRNGCYNKDGISDVTKAILEVLINRYNVKYNTTDSTLITKTIAEHPIVPQEAVLRTRGNLFPSSQINERLNQIDTNPNIFDDVYVGELIFDKAGQVKYVPSDDVPIRVYPTEDNKDKGAIEFYEMPQKNREGKVFPNRYIIGHDPVDDDVSQTMSLTSTFVFDLLTDRIVAEYTGRQEYADDNFEIVRKLCLFYNAKCMYEQNKKGIYSYFKRKGCLTLLAETPEYLKEQNIIKEIGYGNKGVGVNATANVNGFADRLTKEWLIKKRVVLVKEEGQEKEVEIPNLFTVKNRAFLQEAAAYNPTANFDRIRAFGMVMIYREAFLILYQGDTNKAVEEDVDANAPENDEFFQENFDGRFQ